MYRLATKKPSSLIKAARRAGLYPYSLTEAPKDAEAPKTVRGLEALDVVDVERWRLRAAQEEDEEMNPFIVLLERDEQTLGRSFDRSGGAVPPLRAMDQLLQSMAK